MWSNIFIYWLLFAYGAALTLYFVRNNWMDLQHKLRPEEVFVLFLVAPFVAPISLFMIGAGKAVELLLSLPERIVSFVKRKTSGLVAWFQFHW